MKAAFFFKTNRALSLALFFIPSLSMAQMQQDQLSKFAQIRDRLNGLKSYVRENSKRVGGAVAAACTLALVFAFKNSLLKTAVSHGNQAVARALIFLGADVNSGDTPNGDFPLRRAFVNRDVEMAHLLLDFGADSGYYIIEGGKKTFYGAQEESYARYWGGTTVRGAGTSIPCIQAAAASNNVRMIELMHRIGVDLTFQPKSDKNPCGFQAFEPITALNIACYCGSKDVVKYLVREGEQDKNCSNWALWHKKGDKQWKPLDWATEGLKKRNEGPWSVDIADSRIDFTEKPVENWQDIITFLESGEK